MPASSQACSRRPPPPGTPFAKPAPVVRRSGGGRRIAGCRTELGVWISIVGRDGAEASRWPAAAVPWLARYRVSRPEKSNHHRGHEGHRGKAFLCVLRVL